MLGVIKIDEKKVLKPIDEMLADPWQVDIQELFEASVNEPDEIKKNLYDSLYTLIYSQRYAKYPSNTCITRLMGILHFHLLSAQKEPQLWYS
ncbi:hypothetical protein [Liquorilactobacillus vini]|uniref:hypothetical protein n=1 Tax=Liquorilactobacillus vini TaxID=238015 RepID=UPI0002F67DD2|nr:hypothetical protein [Liquorilactobacillus vini]